jgi:long-subunit fatty acid transport protein
MIKRFLVIVAILSTALAAAQENIASPYSYYGIGLTNFKGTVENRSMGGLSVYSDSIHLNLRNPASYGRLRLTTYSLGGSHERTTLKSDDAEGDAKISSLDYLGIGIPVGNNLGFGLGLVPYTSVGYRVLDVQEDVGSRLNGRGGMNKVFLTAGYQVNENLSIGVDANYNFGNFQNSRIVIREDIQYGTRDVRRSDIQGFNFNFGVDYQAMLTDNLKLHVAGTYAPEVDLSSENYRELATVAFVSTGEAVVEARDLNVADTDFALPGQYMIGAGIGEPRKWFVGGEYNSIGRSSFLFNASADNAVYRDAAQYRVGGFFIPRYNSFTSYLGRVVYRAGLRYEETGLHLNNQSIDEFGMSFGIGLPVGAQFSNLNLGIEYGQRGTTDSGLIQENFFKISIGLSLNDKWFERRRFN